MGVEEMSKIPNRPIGAYAQQMSGLEAMVFTKGCPPESYLASTRPLKVITNGSEKIKILEQLELPGITESSIYPEIEHVAGYIRNTHKRFRRIQTKVSAP